MPHDTSKEQSWDLNAGNLTPEPMFSSLQCFQAKINSPRGKKKKVISSFQCILWRYRHLISFQKRIKGSHENNLPLFVCIYSENIQKQFSWVMYSSRQLHDLLTLKPLQKSLPVDFTFQRQGRDRIYINKKDPATLIPVVLLEVSLHHY